MNGTAGHDELVERLKAKRIGSTGRVGSYQVLVNPDGPEAAQALTDLQAELDGLRATLHEIDIEAGNTIPPDGEEAAFAALFRIAQLINPHRLPALSQHPHDSLGGR